MRNVQLLVVDDEAGLLKLVRRQAERRGIDVIEAQTGQAGFEAALTHGPDLILLDLNLPDVSGLTVLSKLKGDPRTAHIPVVAWSGDDSESMARQVAGACAYLEKSNLKQVFERIFAFMPRT